jgi:hypothetical protein
VGVFTLLVIAPFQVAGPLLVKFGQRPELRALLALGIFKRIHRSGIFRLPACPASRSAAQGNLAHAGQIAVLSGSTSGYS